MDKVDMGEMFADMEPVAAKAGEHVCSVGEAAWVSIAVSLKRIADRLDALGEGLNFHALDNQLWQLGQTFGRGLDIGSRGQ